MTRTCDKCHECCIHDKVEALGKLPGEPCKHLTVLNPCGSCGIYNERPNECKLYQCSWLEGLLPECLKPDATGILCETARIEWPKPLTMVMGFEHRPGALAKYHKELCEAPKPGLLIVLVPHDQSWVRFYGYKADVDAFGTWTEQVEREGEVVHCYKDQTVVQKINGD